MDDRIAADAEEFGRLAGARPRRRAAGRECRECGEPILPPQVMVVFRYGWVAPGFSTHEPCAVKSLGYPRWEGTLGSRIHPCRACGIERKVAPWWFDLGPACSPECARELRNARARARRASRRGSTSATCARCAGTFVPARSDARYCSTRCRVAAHRRRSAG